jgi:hypothetical protein
MMVQIIKINGMSEDGRDNEKVLGLIEFIKR